MKKKKIVPKLRQEVKVKVDIVTSDDSKIYYTGKFQDFTARYILKNIIEGILVLKSEFNSFLNYNSLEWTKLKAFADDNLIVAESWDSMVKS